MKKLGKSPTENQQTAEKTLGSKDKFTSNVTQYAAEGDQYATGDNKYTSGEDEYTTGDQFTATDFQFGLGDMDRQYPGDNNQYMSEDKQYAEEYQYTWSWSRWKILSGLTIQQPAPLTHCQLTITRPGLFSWSSCSNHTVKPRCPSPSLCSQPDLKILFYKLLMMSVMSKCGHGLSSDGNPETGLHLQIPLLTTTMLRLCIVNNYHAGTFSPIFHFIQSVTIGWIQRGGQCSFKLY